jgi:dTDP-4-dehydrorhamnose 3,5-epimerase-like enzyme
MLSVIWCKKSMAKLHQLETYSSEKGNLTVFEEFLPGEIKRVFYIYGAEGAVRGEHRHHRAWNALMCVSGRCKVYVNNGATEQIFELDSPDKCLLLEPKDWREMYNFSGDALLLVVSNLSYEASDYITEPYSNTQLKQSENIYAIA